MICYFKYILNIIIKLFIIFIIIFFSNISLKSVKKYNYSKDLKVCLCIMGKNENLYAKEYIKLL